MKKYIVFIALVLAAISVNNSINAYQFSVKNASEANLIIQVELATDKTPYFFYAKKGEAAWQGDVAWFRFSGGYCLNNIRCIIVTDELHSKLKNLGLLAVQNVWDDVVGNKVDKEVVVDNNKMLQWIEGEEKKPNPTYKRISPVVKTGGSAVSGIFCGNYNFQIDTFQGENMVAKY